MVKRLRVEVERARESLFLVPALYVLAAAVVAHLMATVDLGVARRGIELPLALELTAASARVLLSTIAGATITVAGVVFAVTLVSIQLAANQFSPRVIPAFLRDRLQQQVMGIVVGTFVYCLIVLSQVRGPGETTGRVVIPHLSSDLALVLGVVAVLALVAFLDHTARMMQVGQIIERITEETRLRIGDLYPHAARTGPPMPLAESGLPAGDGCAVRSAASGWVRQIDVDALLALTPVGGIFRLNVRNGSFIAGGQTIGMMWPAPDDIEAVESGVRKAVILGRSRLLLQDAALGIRQLVDIALRALSPGINDATTAYEAIVHLGVIVRELLWRDLAPAVRRSEQGTLIAANDLSHNDYVNRAFDQIRLAGASQSAITAILIQTLGGMAADLERDGFTDRLQVVRRQGALAVATYEASQPLPEDLERVHALARKYSLPSLSAGEQGERTNQSFGRAASPSKRQGRGSDSMR